MKKFAVTSLFAALQLLAFTQRVTISGNVRDGKGAPVFPASVYLLNTNYGALTDSAGSFHMRSVVPGTYTMQVSAIGFATFSMDVKAGNAGDISVILDDAAHVLDNVVVSAQKQEELLQKIPFSISALSAKEVQEFRLWNSKELTAIIPNLYSGNSGDDRNVTSIRGITTTSYDPAVATYIDGVNQFNLDTYIANLIDVERIEVLRGPQGTLYGRNAMGGVINIITRQPSNNLNAFAEINAGNFNQQRYTAGLRAPLVKDKLYIGVAGMYNSRDGYYTNDFNNKSYDKQHSVTGNYFLKYMATEKWAFTINFKHYNNRNIGPFPLTFGDETFTNAFHLNQNATATMRDNTMNSSLSINHVGRVFNFSSQTSYQSNQRTYSAPLDGDFSPIDGVTIMNDFGSSWNKVKAFTQEFRFTSPAATTGKLKWTAGTYFFHQDNPTKQATHFGEDAELLGAPDKNFSIINTNKGKSTGAALYGQVTHAIASRVNLIAGIRYDYEKKKYEILGEYEKAPDPAFVITPDTTATVDYSAVSPKIGLSFAVADNSNLYAIYSRGYRTGGFSQLSTDPSQPPLYPYKPEYSNNLEAGIKNTFVHNRIRANVAVFYTRVTDAQVPTLILPDAITVTRNAGKLTSKGFELELAAAPASGLQVSYNLGYTDATFNTLKLSQNGSTVDLDGKRQVFTPNVTSMLVAQYSYDLGTPQRIRLVARGEWFYLGSQYFDLANTIRQSPYQLLNARFGVTTRHFDVMFWGRNLSDQKYIAYAYDFGAIHLGDPKTYGVTLTGRVF